MEKHSQAAVGTWCFLVLPLGPSALCLWLCNSHWGDCPLAVHSGGTWGGLQGALQVPEITLLLCIKSWAGENLTSPGRAKAINSVTVAVILLMSDLPEQSRAFPGDGKQPVPAPCSSDSSLSSRGWCPGQQRNPCDPPQGSHPPLHLELGRFQSRTCHGVPDAFQISSSLSELL